MGVFRIICFELFLFNLFFEVLVVENVEKDFFVNIILFFFGLGKGFFL